MQEEVTAKEIDQTEEDVESIEQFAVNMELDAEQVVAQAAVETERSEQQSQRMEAESDREQDSEPIASETVNREHDSQPNAVEDGIREQVSQHTEAATDLSTTEQVQTLQSAARKKKRRGPTKMRKVAKDPEDKVQVLFTELGEHAGPGSVTLSSFLSALVREHVPVILDDWRKVDDQTKDTLWEENQVYAHYILIIN